MKKILIILLLMVAVPFVSTVSYQESSHEWDVGGPDITPPESV